MSTARRAVVRGKVVELEQPLPLTDGTVVRLIIDPETPERTSTKDEQAKLFAEWALHGPQGPIDDDSDGW